MVINHPLLGPRDASEFVYLGDASLMNRPNWLDKDAEQKFYKYQYLRDNTHFCLLYTSDAADE